MRELRSEEIGDRRVALIETEDISLQSDQNLGLHTASLCYRLRLTEQEARTINWND
jgi:hypothetical protein